MYESKQKRKKKTHESILIHVNISPHLQRMNAPVIVTSAVSNFNVHWVTRLTLGDK